MAHLASAAPGATGVTVTPLPAYQSQSRTVYVDVNGSANQNLVGGEATLKVTSPAGVVTTTTKPLAAGTGWASTAFSWTPAQTGSWSFQAMADGSYSEGGQGYSVDQSWSPVTTIIVQPAPVDPPLAASILPSADLAQTGSTLTLNAQAQDPNGDLASIQFITRAVGTGTWTNIGAALGASGFSAAAEISHVFSQAGSYQVSFIALDAGGRSSQANSSFPPAVATVTVVDILVDEGLNPEPPQPLALPEAQGNGLPGALEGDFSVSNSGSASYSIPLEVTPGRGSMQPSLSLSYSSNSGNGTLGVGWSLGHGFPSAIARGRTIAARDGIIDGPDFDDNDKYYLDGKRLLVVSGAYGAVDSEYRTEVDSFVTIKAEGGGAPGIVTRFVMTDRNGTKYTFGKYASTDDAFLAPAADSNGDHKISPGESDPNAFSFAIKRVEDAIGNAVVFNYLEKHGEHALSSIYYTSNIAASVEPQARVRLVYDANDVDGEVERRDRNVSHYARREIHSTLRLDQIVSEIKSGAEFVPASAYECEYEYSPDTSRTRLKALRHYPRDPESGELVYGCKSDFEWTSTSMSAGAMISMGAFAPAASPLPSFIYDGAYMSNEKGYNPFGFGDFNGDGKTDYVDARDGIKVSRSSGDEFLPPIEFLAENQMPPNWKHSTWPDANAYTGCVFPTDINGDGRADLILTNEWFDLYYVLAQPDGISFSAPQSIARPSDLWAVPSNLANLPNTPIEYERGAAAGRIVTADFTGDGRSDLIVHGYDGRIHLFRWTGTGFASASVIGQGSACQATWHILGDLGDLDYVMTSNDYTIEIIPCELNGDGIADYAWIEKISFATVSMPGPANGASDVCIIQFRAAIMNPQGGLSESMSFPAFITQAFSGSTTGPDAYNKAFIAGDFTGDGLTDFMAFGHAGTTSRMSSSQLTQFLQTGDAGADVGERPKHWTLYECVGEGANGAPQFKFRNNIILEAFEANGQQLLTHFTAVTDSRYESEQLHLPLSEISDPTRKRTKALLMSSTAEYTYAIDVDRDGADDLVWYMNKAQDQSDANAANRGWWVAQSNGTGFDPPLRLQTNPWASVGSDGLSHGGSYDRRRLSQGPDLNGDGIDDWTRSFSSAAGDFGITGYSYSTPGYADLLKETRNSLGRTTTVSYLAGKNDGIYTPGAPVSYPIKEVRSSSPVVSDVWKDSGGSAPAHFGYQYSGNRLDLSGRGSLGFHSFVTLDHQTGLFSYQFLAQSFPMTGLVAREEVYRHWEEGGNDKFRMLSTQTSSVVFDEVAKSDTDTTRWGTLFPFVPSSVKKKWEDASAAHYSFSTGGAPSSKPELLFAGAPPSGHHVAVTAKSWYDNQTLTADPPGTLPSGEITRGNLRKLVTDYGDYTETAVTVYKPVSGALTGLVESVSITATSSFGETAAPAKTYAYWGATPLVASETVDAQGTALDLVTTYTRDALGRVTETNMSGYSSPGPEGAAVVGSTSDDHVQHIGAFKASSATAFDARFDLPTVSKNAEPYNHATTVAYDPFTAQVASVSDANGAAVTTEYDAFGRVALVRDELKSLETTYAIDWTSAASSDWRKTITVSPPPGVAGVTISSVFAKRAAADHQPPATEYYDRLGRVIRTSKEGFNGKITHVDTVYDVLGRVVAVSDPYLKAASPAIYWTKTTYDALGRAKTVTSPNGAVATHDYIGRATTTTLDAPNLGGVDPAPQVTVALADAKGQTVKVWNADNPAGTISPTTGGDSVPSIEYKLDGFGRMRQTKLLGQTATIDVDYDALGNQISLDDPDKGPWTYVSNAFGQVVKQTDARGNVTRTVHDRLGRVLKRETREPNNGAVETASWHYYDFTADAATHRVAMGSKGWIGAPQREESATVGAPGYAAPPTAAVHYYDDKGRPSIDLSSVDGKWLYTVTAYDAASRVQSARTYWRPPEHESPADQPYFWMDWGYAYSYDAKGYLTSVSDTASRVWWSDPDYDHLDRLVSERKGDAYYTQRTYRPQDGVLTAIKTGPTVGSATVQNLSFNFDGLGNLTSRGDGANSETFGYDSVNRLVSRDGSTIAEYEDNGNIEWKKDASGTQSAAYVYDVSKPHAVTSAWGYSMTYDANGNMLTRSKSGQVWSAEWAGFDKPRWLAKDGAGSEFVYGASRDRAIHLEFDAMAGGAPSRYLRKKLYPLGKTVELDYVNTASSGQAWLLDTVRLYVPGPEGLLGAMDLSVSAPAGPPTKAYVYHYDHLGSIQAVTDHADATLQRALDGVGKPSLYSYDPWGERRDPSDWLGKPTATADGGADDATPRGFTGHEMLDDLGLVHMNGRIYDPLLGRFLSADPLIQAPERLQSYNRYSYALNNPVSNIDPSGYLTIEEHKKALAEIEAQRKAARKAYLEKYGILGVLNPFMSKERKADAQHMQNLRSSAGHHKGAIAGIKLTAGIHNALVDALAAVTGTDEATAAKAKVDANTLDDETAEFAVLSGTANQVSQLAADGAATLTGAGALKILNRAKVGSRLSSEVDDVAEGVGDMTTGPFIGNSQAGAINTPALKKLTIDMDHVKSGHMEGGARVSPQKTLFSDKMNVSQVEKSIREAYKNAKRIQTQGDRILLRGTSKEGTKIEMWLNKDTNTIETAYPVGG